MSDQPSDQPKNVAVFPLTFRRAAANEDGQTVYFEVLDGSGKPAVIQVQWENLSALAHMLNQAGVDAAEKRKAAGGSDEFTGVGTAQIVAGFRISNLPERKLKILSLMSPSGLRSDFALGVEAHDGRGRTLPAAIAEGLTKPFP
jgi:hypothetical protein